MNDTLRRLYIILSTALIISGAILALAYGWVGWHVIYAPQEVPVLSYVMGKLPSAADAGVIHGMMVNQPFDITVPQSMVIYGFALLLMAAFGVLLGIARCLSGVGIQLLKVLIQTEAANKQALRTSPSAQNRSPEPKAKDDGYQF